MSNRGLEISVEEIREAKDELIRMSNNPEERELYDMRAKILKDKISELNSAKEDGKLEGKLEGINLTKKVFKLANKGESIGNIAEICEISEEEVKDILE